MSCHDLQASYPNNSCDGLIVVSWELYPLRTSPHNGSTAPAAESKKTEPKSQLRIVMLSQ
jgi:hypothetical protein